MGASRDSNDPGGYNVRERMACAIWRAIMAAAGRDQKNRFEEERP
jgi:hypothetical protein